MPLTQAGAAGPTQFHNLRIVDVAPETDAAVAVTLAPTPDEAHLFRFAPGQHLTLRTELDGEDVRRNYSLFVPPEHGSLRIAIKRVPGGAFSEWAQTGLRPGGTIASLTPRGHFTWAFDAGARRGYVAIAGGSGITPILSLLASGLAREPHSRFTLLYGNRTARSVMFVEALASLKDRYLGRFRAYHFLTAEADDVALFNGRLDEARMAAVLQSLIDPAEIDAAFICGPGVMMDTAERALTDAGVPPAQVLVERFSTRPLTAEQAAARQAASQAADNLDMQVRLEGRRSLVPFDAARGSILESARAVGLAAPYACKAGVCATCRAKLLAGEVSMLANYGLSHEELAQGYILTCQSVPKTAGVVIDYDA